MKYVATFLFIIFSLAGVAFADTCNCMPIMSVGPDVYRGTGQTIPCTCFTKNSTLPSALCGNGTCESGETSSNCCQDCYGNPASRDGVCCAASGETCSNSNDCGACLPVCGNANCETGETSSNCCQDCYGNPASRDGVCCAASGETCSNSNDCGVCPPVCGNTSCETGENPSNCCQDCHGTPASRDGVCCVASGETCSNSNDCGACPVICGQYGCQAGETCSNCSRDCGACGGTGCFLAGTPITLANGSTKPIEQIKVGDHVLAFDEKTKEMKPDKVKKVFVHPKEDAYLIINGHLKVTPVHPVLSQGKWVQIGKLKIGDTLTNTKGEEIPIESMRVVKGKVRVYNIEVNPFHTYIADGFIVHNKKVN